MTSVIGQQFSATSTFAFVIENAPPPFEGTFTLVDGDQLIVTLTVITTTGQVLVTESTAPGKRSVTVGIGGPVTSTPGPEDPEVRFDVCAPLLGEVTCSAPNGPTSFGVLFTGTIGDQFTSHLVSGATPSIYFFNAPRDNISAVFSRAVVTGDLLVVELYIDGQLRQLQANTGDVILQEDL